MYPAHRPRDLADFHSDHAAERDDRKYRERKCDLLDQ